MLRPTLALSILFVAACALEPDTSSLAQQGACTWGCGTNTSYLILAPFYELHPTKPVNGMQIVSFTTKSGTAMVAQVNGSRLYGITATGEKLEGSDLIGSTLLVDDENRKVRWEVTIETVSKVTRYYEDGDDQTLLESYKLIYREYKSGNSFRAMCKKDLDDQPGVPAFHVLVFRGDRYDEGTGSITATGTDADDYFNIACSGDAKAKLLLMRHVEAAQAPGFETTPDQRQAALRGLRADYCGTGTPYTELGVPLDWANVGGWNKIEPANAVNLANNIEAIWNADGAVCLTHPRHVSKSKIHCGASGVPPNCTKYQINHWQDFGDLVTVLPL